MFAYKALRWNVLAASNQPDQASIGVITLNRPDALNAIDVRLRVELDILLDQIRRDDRIRVVIITGEGRGFSAGGDLRSEAGPLGALDTEHDFGAFGAYADLANYFFNDLRHVVIQRVIRKLEELQAVTIAAINGPAVGIGLELATACDMRYASERARLGEVAVPAGFVPESGGARNLPKLVGIGRAMEMILTGEIIDAEEAARIGLVERVFAHDVLLAEVVKIADRIASAPYLSVRQAKALVRRYWDHNKSEEGSRAELEAVMEITRTADCREGISAFLDKRAPEYRGPSYSPREQQR
ncbi:enoyl-CoA hydratase/isomerase family protein [Lacisediminimonas profundi]|uniref:enoyl-CoA hydratase/isomerase family protein n=1 Tax=Lacisediminimonas profundi TaxID=2603856 RepID=UPI0013873915|nr:enoyl-CoA hydratase/isomerase family protein [Lacisediminimonas profundi]